jgi:GH24 family phage-related lysozyme (muramidase)
VKPGEVRTQAQCESGLARGVGKYYAEVDACITNERVPVKVMASVVSWAWNVGTGAACRSTLVKKLNAGEFSVACDELMKWVRAGGRVVQGLVNRRTAERELCLEGVAEGK